MLGVSAADIRIISVTSYERARRHLQATTGVTVAFIVAAQSTVAAESFSNTISVGLARGSSTFTLLLAAAEPSLPPITAEAALVTVYFNAPPPPPSAQPPSPPHLVTTASSHSNAVLAGELAAAAATLLACAGAVLWIGLRRRARAAGEATKGACTPFMRTTMRFHRKSASLGSIRVSFGQLSAANVVLMPDDSPKSHRVLSSEASPRAGASPKAGAQPQRSAAATGSSAAG
jgi:hypothetical protein